MTNLQKLLEQCRDAVAGGDIAAALEGLAQVLPESDRPARNEMILHRARLKRIEDQERKGMEVSSQRIQLADHVLQFLDEVARKLESRSSVDVAPTPMPGDSDAQSAPIGSRYDAFLSHSSKDKPVVRDIARMMEARGLRVWLDEKDIPPGQPWISQLEDSVALARTVVVFLGPSDMGSWQRAETWLALRKAFEHGHPLVPVWLPGVTAAVNSSEFLSLFTWVDLSTGLTKEGMDRLCSAISNAKPVTLQ